MSKTTDILTELKKASDVRSKSKRSKRVQILITPQTFSKLKEISADTGASVNEIINRAIESFIEDL